MNPRRSAGFTMVELVMVIVIAGILGVGVTSFITQSVSGYVDTARRQSLAETGLVATEKITRELRAALPGSIRLFAGAGGQCLEFIPVRAGSTYETAPVAPDPAASSLLAVPAGQDTTGYLVINPQTAANLYAGGTPGIRTSDLATLPAGAGPVTVSWSGSHQFPSHSPTRRFFLVGPPVAYCQVGSRLFRYTDYGFEASALDVPAKLPTAVPKRALLLDRLAIAGGTTLTWTRHAGSAHHNEFVRVSFSLVDSRAPSEVVRVEQEVQLRNVR